MITPQDFRQPGDSVLKRLQRFFDALGDGVVGQLDADYVIPSQLVISEKSKFTLDGNGHRITLKSGAPTGWGGSALYIVRCTDFVITRLICDGNRANRVPAEDSAHVIVIDKCHRWTFRDVQAVNGTCDGFYISAGSAGNGTGPGGKVLRSDCPTGWTMTKCIAIENFRQGLSIIEGIDGTIDGGRYGRTHGLWDSGNGPCAGIDIEPDNRPGWPPDRVENIDIRGVMFDENQGAGLAITRVNGVRTIRVTDCIFDRNAKAAIESVADGVEIVRPRVRGWNSRGYTTRAGAPPKRGAIDIGYRAGTTKIVDPVFELTDNGSSKANPCIYVHATAAPQIQISGIRTDGSASVICSAHSPYVSVSDSVIDLRASTQSDAFTFLGDYPTFQRTMLLGIYRRAAYFSGKAPRILDNCFHVRVADPSGYIVSSLDSTAPEFRRNLVQFDTPASSYAFGVGRDATLVDNKVANDLASEAFRFAGPPRINTGNQRSMLRTTN